MLRRKRRFVVHIKNQQKDYERLDQATGEMEHEFKVHVSDPRQPL